MRCPIKIINIQKDPTNEKNTFKEIDSIQYAKDNYASDFLKGYLTASILQSVLGGNWFSGNGKSDYAGYSSQPSVSHNTKRSTKTDPNAPTTSDRAGSFSSKIRLLYQKENIIADHFASIILLDENLLQKTNL